MTNLIPSARRRWINRGRVLVGLPIAFGLFFSSLLFLLVLRPIWQDVQELERRRDSLLNLQRNLPALQQQLEKETVVLAQAELQQALKDIYGTVDHIDLWIGGLAEDHVPGAAVGPLVLVSLADQFTRLRDGDPFFHVGDRDLQRGFIGKIIDLNEVTLGRVIRENTGLRVPENMFVVQSAGEALVVSDQSSRTGRRR